MTLVHNLQDNKVKFYQTKFCMVFHCLEKLSLINLGDNWQYYVRNET